MNFPDACMINAANQVKNVTFSPTFFTPYQTRGMLTTLHNTVRFGEPIGGYLFKDTLSEKIFSFELFFRDETYILHSKNMFNYNEETAFRCYQLGHCLLEEMKTFAFTDPSFRLKLTMKQLSFSLSEELESLSKGEPS